MPGEIQPGIHRCSIQRLVESTRRDRNKGVLVTAPTLKKEEKRSVTRSVVSPIKRDAVYLNQKSKMGYVNIDTNNK
jgi:hypothetical protein